MIQQIKDKIEHSEAICGKIQPLCDPLTRAFGIQTFGYRKFFPDGTCFGTSTNSRWERVRLEKFYNTILPNYAEEVSSTLQSEKHFVLRIGEPNHQDVYLSALFDYDVWNTLSLYRKNKDFVEAFYFASTKENYKIIEDYINNVELFERFTFYFKEKFTDILTENEVKKASFSIMSPTVFEVENKASFQEEECIQDFISNTPIHSLSLNVDGKEVPLSIQEFKCLAWLSRGKTAKEVGRIMNLSPRTVESYMDNVKFKTRIDSRSKLIDLFILNFYKGSDLLKCIENKSKKNE